MATNDDLLDRQVSHQVDLQRYSTHVVRQIIRLLIDSERDVRSKLKERLSNIEVRGYDLGPVTTKRLRSLEKTLEASRIQAYAAIQDKLAGDMVELATIESEFQLSVLDDVIPVKLDWVALTPNQLKNIATRRPFQGRLLREWVTDLEASDRKALRQAIQIGMIEGESTAQITSRILNRLHVSRRHAETITRTAINHVSNQARSEIGAANSDIIKAERWVSTLDGRTSSVCRGRDGKQYEPGVGPRPPAHLQCRSTMTFITKSWKELGIDLEEAPPGTRASMNGQVPDDVNYDSWLRGQSIRAQNNILGKSDARLFRNGDLTLDKFVDRSGKAYTLDQLRSKYPDAWKKAFADPSIPEGMEFVTRTKAIDYVKEHGRATNVEHAVAFSRLGEPLLVKSGEARSVSFTEAEVERIRLADGVEMVHNHPSGTTLSGADLKFAVSAEMDKITAVGTHEASEFVAETVSKNLRGLTRADDTANTLVQQALFRAIRNNEMTVETAEGIHAHLINRILDRAGFINYTVVAPNKKLVEAEKLADTEAMNTLVDNVSKEVKEWL